MLTSEVATGKAKDAENLSESLVPVYGSNYSKRNLDYYRKFYLLFPDIQIVNARVHNLEWSHIRRVLSAT